MFTPELTLVVIALLVVGADIFIRLILAPRRQDNFLSQLFDQISDQRPRSAYPKAVPPFVSTAHPLEESLLRRFEHCALSRYILKEASPAELHFNQELLLERLNQERSASRKTILPGYAFESVLRVLTNAGLISLNNGFIQLTTQGQQLARLMAARASR